MKIQRPLRPLLAFATFLSRLGACSVLFISMQFAFAVVAGAQTPTTLQGRLVYRLPDDSRQPAAGVSVTMTKTIYDVSPPVVTTETTTTDGSGHYSFQSEARCSVGYEMQASSSEMVDDEPLTNSSISSTSGCVGDATFGDLVINRPMPITLAGYVIDESGNHVQGVTVTMTRTKYDLNPNVLTTATTSTDANGHYQFITFSRCSVLESFRPSIGSYTFDSYFELSGCIVGSYDNLNLFLTFNSSRDAGSPGCNAVGKPVNVTNGNVYLQQADYHLPGIGAVDITRSYNSSSQNIGLFGRGWTSLYDESVATVSGSLLEFRMSDGRVVTSGITPDFFGQIVRNGDDTYTVTFKGGAVHQFNSSGKLLSLRDSNGNQTALAYDANGYLTSVTDPFGRVLTFTTNGGGQVLSISDTLGTIASYTYDSSQLRSVTYADNSAYHFAYDGGGISLLSDVTDALGNTIEHHDYDSHFRATTSEAQGGVERYTLSYISQTETDVTDALGHVTKYFFNSVRGRNAVTRIEGACGCGGGAQVNSWTYDDRLNVTSKTDALGHVTGYTVDQNGNPLTITDATGTINATYNQFGDPLTLTDQLNGTTTNTYDAQGNLLTTTDALNHATSFTYNPRGQVLTATDARGKTTTFTYDTGGNLAQSKNANNAITSYFYDARSRVTKVRDALSRETLYAYDAAGRPNKITHPDDSFISFTYDLAGRRTTLTDERGNATNYGYDSANRLTSVMDALGQTTTFGHDAMSNLVSVADALSRTTNYEYDDFNRPVKTIYPPATPGSPRLLDSVTYDAAGNIRQRTDTAGRVSSFVYDDANRVIHTTDPDNKATDFEYDGLSRMTALVDALGQRYRFNYDSVGRLKHLRRGTTVMTFTYDAVGNRKHRTDYNGALTVYDYDALNRLKTITYPDTTRVSYTYDKVSRLQTATNENGAVEFNYNKMNRLTSVIDVFGQETNYNYDPNGNRTKLSLNAAVVATYRYDSVNRLTKLLETSGAAFTFDYDAISRLTQQKAPNGVKTNYQYDGMDRLTRMLDNKGAATIADRQYQYNTANQITQITEPTITRSFSYDPLDRLVSAGYTNPLQANENYAYDAVGNRTSSHLSASYTYQQFNRLSNTNTASYSYDTNGNLISKTEAGGTTLYSWDFENRLKRVTLPNGSSVTYKFDALGRRIQRAPSAGVATNFIYDGQDVIRDVNSDGSTVDYLNGPGIDNKLRLIDSRLTTLGPLYFLQDHLGSTTKLTNSAGGVVEQDNYDSFGKPASSSLTRYSYTGRERDPDTGLMYYRARWYDPQTGRFISEDPIGLAGGINLFAYVGNGPIDGRDPQGLHNEDVHYYLTYFLATRFPCLTADEARLIADADQSTDENPDTEPWPGWTEGHRQTNSNNHAFNPGNDGNLASLRDAAMSGGSNYVKFGRYLHYLQDTYSHRGFYSNVYGQFGYNGRNRPFIGGFEVDDTNDDVGKSAQMAAATWFAIRDWIKAHKCQCVDQGDTNVDAWWPQVVAFLNMNNDDLEGKRRTLNVPLR